MQTREDLATTEVGSLLMGAVPRRFITTAFVTFKISRPSLTGTNMFLSQIEVYAMTRPTLECIGTSSIGVVLQEGPRLLAAFWPRSPPPETHLASEQKRLVPVLEVKVFP